MKLTRKQRIVAGLMFFGALTLMTYGFSQDHWFTNTYMLPSIWGFFMVYVPLSAVYTSTAFDVIFGIVLTILPTVLYTAITVVVLELWDRFKKVR